MAPYDSERISRIPLGEENTIRPERFHIAGHALVVFLSTRLRAQFIEGTNKRAKSRERLPVKSAIPASFQRESRDGRICLRAAHRQTGPPLETCGGDDEPHESLKNEFTNKEVGTYDDQ